MRVPIAEEVVPLLREALATSSDPELVFTWVTRAVSAPPVTPGGPETPSLRADLYGNRWIRLSALPLTPTMYARDEVPLCPARACPVFNGH